MPNIFTPARQAWTPTEARDRGLTDAITRVIDTFGQTEQGLRSLYRGATILMENLPAFSPAARDAAFTAIWIQSKAYDRGIDM